MKEENEHRILRKLSDLDKKLEALERRLFLDNGNLSLQSKINRNSQTLKLVVGVFTVIGTFVLTLLGVFIKRQIGE